MKFDLTNMKQQSYRHVALTGIALFVVMLASKTEVNSTLIGVCFLLNSVLFVCALSVAVKKCMVNVPVYMKVVTIVVGVVYMIGCAGSLF